MASLSRHLPNLDLILMRPRFGKLMRRLHPHQRLGLESERLLEPDRHVGRQTLAAVEQFADRLPRHVQVIRQVGDVQAGRRDNLLPQPLAGMDREARMKLDGTHFALMFNLR
jgi:hypothetical protein